MLITGNHLWFQGQRSAKRELVSFACSSALKFIVFSLFLIYSWMYRPYDKSSRSVSQFGYSKDTAIMYTTMTATWVRTCLHVFSIWDYCCTVCHTVLHPANGLAEFLQIDISRDISSQYFSPWKRGYCVTTGCHGDLLPEMSMLSRLSLGGFWGSMFDFPQVNAWCWALWPDIVTSILV